MSDFFLSLINSFNILVLQNTIVTYVLGFILVMFLIITFSKLFRS